MEKTICPQPVSRKTCRPLPQKAGNQAGSLGNPRPRAEFLLASLQLEGSYHRQRCSPSSFTSRPEQQGRQASGATWGGNENVCKIRQLPDSSCGWGAPMRSAPSSRPLGQLSEVLGHRELPPSHLNTGTKVKPVCLWQSGLWILKICSDWCLASGRCDYSNWWAYDRDCFLKMQCRVFWKWFHERLFIHDSGFLYVKGLWLMCQMRTTKPPRSFPWKVTVEEFRAKKTQAFETIPSLL